MERREVEGEGRREGEDEKEGESTQGGMEIEGTEGNLAQEETEPGSDFCECQML